MHPYVNTAVKAARSAGRLILKASQRVDLIEVSKKGDKDFVTNMDKISEQEIIYILQEAYPHHGIITEESGVVANGDHQWIIDPIDGTMNFLHGLPHFCISIALQHKGRTEHGVIYDPIRDDLFTASRGEGVQKNDNRLRVSAAASLHDALIGTGFPTHLPNEQENFFKALSRVTQASGAVRRTGSAALDLAYIAAGHFDGMFTMGLKLWDMAAGVLMIREAGGLISDIYGGNDYLKNGSIITGGPKIFKQLSAELKPFFSRA